MFPDEGKKMTDTLREAKRGKSRPEKMLQWDRMIAEALADGRSFAEIMDTGKLFLQRPYAFVDTTMEYIYATGDYMRRASGTDSPDPDADDADQADYTVQELMLDKKFHEAAKETTLFYYSAKDAGKPVLCCNIFMNGKYYARMLLDIEDGKDRVSSEEEALFLFFCRRIENILASVPGLLKKQQSDSLHSYLSALASGQEVPKGMLKKAAEDAGFKGTDNYCVIYLSFYSDEGWETQYETTLPYMSHMLEVKWKFSCAVPAGRNLVWLVDLEKSEANVKSRSFYQELAFFLREHICTAGVSSRFTDLDSTFHAVKQAQAALDLGRQVQPSFWYYLFDDYRLYYMLRKAGDDIPVQYLKPASLLTLEEYDGERNAELCKTLRTYLRNNRTDTRTAELLHVHRTTLFRRLEKIHQLTGLRLDDPDTVLELLIIWRMAGE